MTFDLTTLPVLTSHYTEENVHIGVDPVYLMKKGYSKKMNILSVDDLENKVTHNYIGLVLFYG